MDRHSRPKAWYMEHGVWGVPAHGWGVWEYGDCMAGIVGPLWTIMYILVHYVASLYIASYLIWQYDMAVYGYYTNYVLR